MRYQNSIHFREDPYEEVDAALSANCVNSVQQTLENRLLTEENYTPPNAPEIERLKQQLEYIGSLAVESAAA